MLNGESVVNEKVKRDLYGLGRRIRPFNRKLGVELFFIKVKDGLRNFGGSQMAVILRSGFSFLTRGAAPVNILIRFGNTDRIDFRHLRHRDKKAGDNCAHSDNETENN